jgi:hypothetical protein
MFKEYGIQVNSHGYTPEKLDQERDEYYNERDLCIERNEPDPIGDTLYKAVRSLVSFMGEKTGARRTGDPIENAVLFDFVAVELLEDVEFRNRLIQCANFLVKSDN